MKQLLAATTMLCASFFFPDPAWPQAAGGPRPGFDRPAPGRGTRSVVTAKNGMVCASQPLAVAAGVAILRRGGNAFDAAVGTAAVLNVVEPMMTGIGGDMFALCWPAREGK